MLSDSPIRKTNEDLLRRVPLAQKVASLISQYSEDESIVVGIDGSWGSGKTSFINLINEILVHDDKIVLVEFNPWNFSDQDELIQEFFNTLLASIKDHIKDKKTAIKKILDYAGRLAKGGELSIEPEISILGFIKFKVGKLQRVLGEKTLTEYRNSVDEIIKGTEKKIVIWIDDTDRLDIDETKIVLKIIKMTANFHNTVFVLSYDRAKVAEKIEEKGLPGEEYLKKIVQINFKLPIPEQQDIFRIFFRDIDSIIADIEEKRWEANRWRSLFNSGFKDFFKTIRDIKRFVSSLDLDFTIVGKNEVNPVDFIGVELLRVFAPDIYSNIGDNQELFTGSEQFWNRKDHDTRMEAIDKIIDTYPDADQRENLKKVIRELFPILHGGSLSDDFRKDLRVAFPDMFGRYFQMGTPSGTVSEETIRALMASSLTMDELTQNFEHFQAEGKLRNVLVRAIDYIENLSKEQKKTLLLTLFTFGDQVSSERLAMFDMEDEDSLILRLIYHVIKSVPNDDRTKLLAECIEQSNTVFTGVNIVQSLDHENLQYKNNQSITKPIINEKEILGLKTLIVKQINEAEKNDTLIKVKRLLFVLFRWKEWGGEAEVSSFINKCLDNHSLLAKLLATFVSRVFSSSGDYNRISKKSLGELCDIQLFEDAVSNINNSELAAMSDSEKEAIDLFRNPPDNY